MRDGLQWEADAITVDQKTYYTGGLFKYDAGLDASNVKDKNSVDRQSAV